MATTSTKAPPVIKSDIRRVLERMQVQYRETKGGYECIHLPSIDFNSLTETQAQKYQQQQQQQRSSGSEGTGTGTTKRSIVRKASKLTFSGNKGKDKEQDATVGGGTTMTATGEKEAQGRPSATASSGSSSFFNIPTTPAPTQANAPERPPSATGAATTDTDTADATAPAPAPAAGTGTGAGAGAGTGAGAAEGSHPSLVVQDDSRPRSPSKPKFLPPIPRDFALPQPVQVPETSRPTLGEVEKDPFDAANQSGLSVRFEINIVKVRRASSSSLGEGSSLFITDLDAGPVAPTTRYTIPKSRRRRLAISNACTTRLDRAEIMTPPDNRFFFHSFFAFFFLFFFCE